MGLFDYFKEKRVVRLRHQHQQTLSNIATQLQRSDISCIEILIISTELVRYLLDMDLLTEPTQLQMLRKYRMHAQTGSELYGWLSSASVQTAQCTFDTENVAASARRVQIVHPQDWFEGSSVNNFLLGYSELAGAIIEAYQELQPVDQLKFQTKYHRLGMDAQVIVGDFILGYITECLK